MKAKISIDAGICGFHTQVVAESQDDQMVELHLQTGCEKIRSLARLLEEKGAVDAYQEVSPAQESTVMSAVRATLKGCCAGCAVPVGIFKGMQVAAGLALPKDIGITITKV